MHITPLKSIRLYCVGCSGGQRKEVALCVIPDCPLFPYRFGKRPVNKKDAEDINIIATAIAKQG